MSRLRTLLDPPRFQSADRTGGWFEGWYFKLVGRDGTPALAVIPGISHDATGATSHSFVQLIRPGGQVGYVRMPFDAFSWRDDRFAIRVGGSTFSAEGLELDLPATDEVPRISGRVDFGALSRWPVTLTSPGIMGWYRYVPRMECYHAIVSMDHELTGSLSWGTETLDFSGGRGYAEKDWGTGFPSAWMWAHSNHFSGLDGRDRPGVSLTCSVARIPWLGSSFVGHIAGLLVDGRLYRFATYTGSRLTDLDIGIGRARVAMNDKRWCLEVEVDGARSGALKAPVDGVMSGRADESLDATVRVSLTDMRGVELFRGVGAHAGVELMDPRGELCAVP